MHQRMKLKKKMSLASILFVITCALEIQCSIDVRKTVSHEERWGIYILDLATEKVELIYTSPQRISGLHLDNKGETLVFTQRINGDNEKNEEIYIMKIDGSGLRRITENAVMDTYPCWSPDSSKIAFLSWRDETMDIYITDIDGNVKKLYDSGFHDGDIDWVDDTIVFTRNSQIWMMNSNGTNPHKITDPPRAGEWGNAVLPFGDYDPRLSPDGTRILFERMVADESPHGNYNIYVINADGSHEQALTDTGYTQGLANWSHKGDRILYSVTAIGEEGKYDIYLMNADGTENRNITPQYFPENFLCHSPIFSSDDSKVFFIGEWWEQASGFGILLAFLGLFAALLGKRTLRK